MGVAFLVTLSSCCFRGVAWRSICEIPRCGSREVGGRLDRSASVEFLQSFEKIPGEPFGECLADAVNVLVKGHQVIEGIDTIQLASVNQTHEHITDLSSSECLEAQGILSVKDGHFQSSLAEIMPTRGLCRVGVERSINRRS